MSTTTTYIKKEKAQVPVLRFSEFNDLWKQHKIGEFVKDRKEVAENDYNLNIPRYVDTFEEEEPVDLAAVAQELKAIDKDMATTDATIADYCNQLGIETPF